MLSTLNKRKYFCIFILLLILLIPISTSAKNKIDNKNIVNIYFFHSKDCTHCNSEIKFLDSLEKKYNNIKIYRYEVHDESNNQKRLDVIELYNLKSNGVPITIIGNTPYIGYIEEYSNINFIKTIEYYSRYGYHDKVGELLQINNLPTFPIDKKAPSLDSFQKEYGNYKLIASLYTNDLELSTTTAILGLITNINPIIIIALILINIVTIKKEAKYSPIYILLFITTTFIITTIYIFSSWIYSLITLISIIILLYYIITRILKAKKQRQLISFIIIISLLCNVASIILYSNQYIIFNKLLFLHNLTGINKLYYYGNYLTTALTTNIIILLITLYINSIISKSKVSE